MIRNDSSLRASRKLVALLSLLLATAASAEEIHVVTSGAFTAAYLQLVPQFEQATHNKVVTAFGASMGNTPTAIPNRLERGEALDVVIMAAPALDKLIAEGKVAAGSKVDLVRSSIAMVVRAGAPKPDISTVEALKRTLLAAKSIAYSDSASGVYLANELFPRLGIAEQIKDKCHKIEGTPVGKEVAAGRAEIGFQQVSELLPVPGVDLVGKLPAEAQRVTIFAAGIVAGAQHPDAARTLIRFLTSPEAGPVIEKTGLEPVGGR